MMSAIPKIRWQDVVLWDADGRHPIASEHRRAMREFRATAAIWGYWMVDPSEWTDTVRAETEARAREKATKASLQQHRQYCPSLLKAQAPQVRVCAALAKAKGG